MFILFHFGGVLLQSASVAISANELRTRADTEWIVAAAANVLPRGSILAVGGVLSNSTDAATRESNSRDRGPLDVVARSLGLPLDTSTVASNPPYCASDTNSRGPHGYRIERVSIARDDHHVAAGRSDWFHYVVSFTRTCRTELGHRHYIGSDVRFDAVPDVVFGYKWAVGKVDQYADPLPDRVPTFWERHGGMGFVLKPLLYGAIIFPVLGLLFGILGGDGGLLRLLGVWSIVGLAMAILMGVGGIVGGLVVFVLPAAAYVAAARRPQSTPAFGRATLIFVLAYPICVILAMLAISSGFP
ncbi:MAG TPA: hypothetical protein VK544_10245 [Gemmatimonadaceae bacterium]|nr:hypothetical protein [Gemmatimonadaceae bacterium]